MQEMSQTGDDSIFAHSAPTAPRVVVCRWIEGRCGVYVHKLAGRSKHNELPVGRGIVILVGFDFFSIIARSAIKFYVTSTKDSRFYILNDIIIKLRSSSF